MNTYSFKNRYGTLTLVATTFFLPVSTIRGKDLPAAVKMSIDIAEQIALITGNKGIQVCFDSPFTGTAYVIIHDSPSTAAVAQIKHIDYVHGITAQSELSALPKRETTFF